MKYYPALSASLLLFQLMTQYIFEFTLEWVIYLHRKTIVHFVIKSQKLLIRIVFELEQQNEGNSVYYVYMQQDTN